MGSDGRRFPYEDWWEATCRCGRTTVVTAVELAQGTLEL